MTNRSCTNVAAFWPRFLFVAKRSEANYETSEDYGMSNQRKEGARRVGRALLYGAGNELRAEDFESVWRIWAVRRGSGEWHGADSASAGEVHGFSGGQGIQHQLLWSKTGAEALRVCSGDGGFFCAVYRPH